MSSQASLPARRSDSCFRQTSVTPLQSSCIRVSSIPPLRPTLPSTDLPLVAFFFVNFMNIEAAFGKDVAVDKLFDRNASRVSKRHRAWIAWLRRELQLEQHFQNSLLGNTQRFSNPPVHFNRITAKSNT